MATLSISASLTATLSLAVSVVSVTPVTAADSVTTGSSGVGTRVQLSSGESTFTATSTAAYVRLFGASGASVAIADSTATAKSIRFVSGGSEVLVLSSASYTGESGGIVFALTKDVWVMNAVNNAVSRYTEFDYSGIAYVNGKTYAVGDDGIFELTGSTDSADNLSLYVESPARRVENHILSPRYAYVIGNLPENTATAAPGLTFQIMTDDKERYDYDIDPTEHDMQTSRVVFGRGLRSRHVRYSLKGAVSEPVTVTSIDVYFDETRRGIK